MSGAAGPFRMATVIPRTDDGGPGRPMTVVGRDGAGRGVDEVALLERRWARHPGGIVLSADASLFPAMGMKVTVPARPGAPKLTVAGVARSVTRTADAWVVASRLPALTAPGSGGYGCSTASPARTPPSGSPQAAER